MLTRVARARQLGLDFEDPAQRLALHVLCHALASLSAEGAPGTGRPNGEGPPGPSPSAGIQSSPIP